MEVGVVSGLDGPTHGGCMCTKDEWRGKTQTCTETCITSTNNLTVFCT